MRQMTDGRENAIMHFRRQLVNIRPAQGPGTFDVVERVIVVFRQRGHNHLLALIQIPASGRGATVFSTGNGMRRHKLANAIAKAGTCRTYDIALGGATVSDDRIRT